MNLEDLWKPRTQKEVYTWPQARLGQEPVGICTEHNGDRDAEVERESIDLYNSFSPWSVYQRTERRN